MIWSKRFTIIRLPIRASTQIRGFHERQEVLHCQEDESQTLRSKETVSLRQMGREMKRLKKIGGRISESFSRQRRRITRSFKNRPKVDWDDMFDVFSDALAKNMDG